MNAGKEKIDMNTFFNLAKDLLCIANLEGDFLKLNGEWERALGYSIKELEGHKFIDFVHPDDVEDTLKAANELGEGKTISNFTNRYRCRDGSYKWIEWRSIAADKLIYAAARDITEHKELEDGLRDAKLMLQTVINHLPIGIFWKDLDLKYAGYNNAFAEDAGIKSSDSMIGKSDFDAPWKDLADYYRNDDMEVINSNIAHFNIEEKFEDQNGIKWIRRNKLPITGTGNKVIGVLGTYEDITELKQKQIELSESEEKYKSLFYNQHLVTLILNPATGEIVDANPAACNYYGLSRTRITSMMISEINTLSIDELKTEMQRARENERNYFSFRHKLANGEIRDVEVFSGPIKINDRNLLYSVVHDVTERKRIETALKKSEAKFRNLVDNSMVGVFQTKTDGSILYANDTLRQTLEYEMFNDSNGFEAGIVYQVPSQRHEFVKGLQTTGKVTGMEITMITRTGRLVNTLVSASLSGDIIDGTMVDITKLKEAINEIELKNEELQKLNSEKDKLFSIIAHDLKSPFQGFIGLTKIMAEEIGNFTLDQLSELSRDMNKSANNLLKFLTNLLNWSQIQNGTIDYIPRPCSLLYLSNSGVESIKTKASLKEISILNSISESYVINADENMISSVFRNLLSNAVKFTPRGGKIKVTAGDTGSGSVKISISDSGIGMPDYILNNLFRLEKKVGRKGTEGEESTGLGLILCKEFIEKHNGAIEVESSEVEGTIFSFTLPLFKVNKLG